MRIAGCLSLLLILAVVGGLLAYRWYRQFDGNPAAAFSEPKVELYSFFIKSFDLNQTTADVQLLIDNTAPLGLTADSLQYTVYIESTEVTSGSYTQPIRVKAGDTTLITIPVTVDNHKLLSTLRNLEGKRDSADYTLNAEVFTDMPFLKGRPLQIRITRRMPVYIVPEMKFLQENLLKPGL